MIIILLSHRECHGLFFIDFIFQTKLCDSKSQFKVVKSSFSSFVVLTILSSSKFCYRSKTLELTKNSCCLSLRLFVKKCLSGLTMSSKSTTFLIPCFCKIGLAAKCWSLSCRFSFCSCRENRAPLTCRWQIYFCFWM